MQINLLGWGAAIVVGIGFAFATIDPRSVADNIARQIQAANPDLANADISLDACQLSIQNQGVSDTNQVSSTAVLYADLRLFDLQNVQIATREDGVIVLLIERAAVGPELVAQAGRVMALLPDRLMAKVGGSSLHPLDGADTAIQKVSDRSQPGWSEAQLYEYLAQPRSTLAIRLDGVRVGGGDGTNARIQPHADAPDFHDFANAVQRMDSPKTVTTALIFSGPDAESTRLISGLVAIPNTLVLNANSRLGAHDLAQALLDYKVANCVG